MAPSKSGEPNSRILNPLPREKLSERLFDIFKRDILSGHWKDGERLPTIEQLASQMRVSRTAMREALQKLSSIGLVEMRHGSGTYVKHLSANMLIEPMMDALSLEDNSTHELMEVRFYFEQIAARLAAVRAQPGDIAFLAGIHESMIDAMEQGDLAVFAQHDFLFHFALARIAGNRILRKIITVIREMMQQFINNYSRLPGAPGVAVEDHLRIIRAMEQHDPEAAEQAMKFHLQHVISTLKTSFGWEFDIPV